MEDLSTRDTSPSPGGGPNAHGPPIAEQVPQLPPQMFTTAAQLLDLTDSELSSMKPGLLYVFGWLTVGSLFDAK